MSNLTNEIKFECMMEIFKGFHALQCKQAREKGQAEPVYYWDNIETMTKAICELAPLPQPPKY